MQACCWATSQSHRNGASPFYSCPQSRDRQEEGGNATPKPQPHAVEGRLLTLSERRALVEAGEGALTGEQDHGGPETRTLQADLERLPRA